MSARLLCKLPLALVALERGKKKEDVRVFLCLQRAYSLLAKVRICVRKTKCCTVINNKISPHIEADKNSRQRWRRIEQIDLFYK